MTVTLTILLLVVAILVVLKIAGAEGHSPGRHSGGGVTTVTEARTASVTAPSGGMIGGSG